MSKKPYLVISGSIFGIVSILHLLRGIYDWPVELNNVPVPTWASWVGFVVAAALSIWAFRLASE